MKQPSAAITSMPRSGIRVIMDLAMAMPDCIRLEVGEPNFATAPHIIEASHRAALDGQTKYTDNSGIIGLREAIAEHREIQTGANVQPEQVIVTSGAMGALFSTFTVLLDPGDEVIVFNPSWPNYQMQLQLIGATPVMVATSAANGYLPTVEQLEAAETSRTKVVVVNTPSNPTGAMIDGDRLASLVEFTRSIDAYLVADEVYEEIVFDKLHVPTASHDTDGRVVSIHSFSKTYAMTGWRVGYAVAPPDLASLIRKCQEPIIGCVNAPAQHAALAALTGPQEMVEEMRNAYRERRDIVLDLLDRAGVPAFKPEGAFYMWVDISKSGRTDADFAVDLIKNHKVAVVPGTTFGAENTGRVRITLAADSNELEEGVRRLISEVER